MATKAMKIMSKHWALVDYLIYGFKHGDYTRAKREKRADHEWDVRFFRKQEDNIIARSPKYRYRNYVKALYMDDSLFEMKRKASDGD